MTAKVHTTTLRTHFAALDSKKEEHWKADRLAHHRKLVAELAKTPHVDAELAEWFAMNVDAALKRAEMTRDQFFELVAKHQASKLAEHSASDPQDGDKDDRSGHEDPKGPNEE